MQIVQGAANSTARTGAETSAESQVRELYGGLLGGPKQAQRAAAARERDAALAVGSPEGTAALSEGIAGQLKGHVEWQHQAHHRLLPVHLHCLFQHACPAPELLACQTFCD